MHTRDQKARRFSQEARRPRDSSRTPHSHRAGSRCRLTFRVPAPSRPRKAIPAPHRRAPTVHLVAEGSTSLLGPTSITNPGKSIPSDIVGSSTFSMTCKSRPFTLSGLVNVPANLRTREPANPRRSGSGRAWAGASRRRNVGVSLPHGRLFEPQTDITDLFMPEVPERYKISPSRTNSRHGPSRRRERRRLSTVVLRGYDTEVPGGTPTQSRRPHVTQ